VTAPDVDDATATACADEYEALIAAGVDRAAAYRGSLVVLHRRREQEMRAAHPRCTVPAVLAECDAETLSDIWQGGGQGR
jgi:hypothetical protein